MVIQYLRLNYKLYIIFLLVSQTRPDDNPTDNK